MSVVSPVLIVTPGTAAWLTDKARRPYSAIRSASATQCVIFKRGKSCCAFRLDTFLSPLVRHDSAFCHFWGVTSYSGYFNAVIERLERMGLSDGGGILQ